MITFVKGKRVAWDADEGVRVGMIDHEFSDEIGATWWVVEIGVNEYEVVLSNRLYDAAL